MRKDRIRDMKKDVNELIDLIQISKKADEELLLEVSKTGDVKTQLILQACSNNVKMISSLALIVSGLLQHLEESRLSV